MKAEGSRHARGVLWRARLVGLGLLAWTVPGPKPAQAQTEAIPVSVADTARPGANRLFFAPTGRTLPAGVAEAGTYYLVAPYLGYAFHRRFMVAAGSPLLPEVFGRFWYVAPKLGLVVSRHWNVSAGALAFVEMGSADPLPVGEVVESFVWGVVTFGGPRAAATLGVATDAGSVGVLPDGSLLILGGEYEVGRRARDAEAVSLRLIAESYLDGPPSFESPDDGSLHLLGVRIRSGRVAVELAEAITVQSGDVEVWTAIPLFHLSVLF